MCKDLGLIIQLVSGAVVGNIAGGSMKNASLGTALNSVVGAIGGGSNGQFISMLVMYGTSATGYGMDIAGIISQISGGGACGSDMLAVIGIIKGAIAKQL